MISATEPEREMVADPDTLTSLVQRSRVVGYRSLLLLAFVLPFDLERHPLYWSNSLSITNLTVLILGVAGLALISLTSAAREAFRGSKRAAAFFSQRRLALVLLAGYCVSAGLTTVMSSGSTQGLTWYLEIVSGALIWLVMPLWLAFDTTTKIKQLGIAIVTGAVVAAAIGFAEVSIGAAFDQHLGLFKFGPDIMGPYLRLSGPFSSSNVAAMYFELALPFATVGLLGVAGRAARQPFLVLAWLAAADLLFIALVLTYSRGARIGLLAAGLAIALASRQTWRRATGTSWARSGILAANLVLVIGILAVSVPQAALLRVASWNDREWYQATYASKVPTLMTAGTAETVDVSVTNRSPVAWDASSPQNYGLSYHWLHSSWKVARFANPISWLAVPVPSGGRATVRAAVAAPSAPGNYLLVWDVVWKGTTWFGPRSGQYQAFPVRVVTGGTDPSGASSSKVDPPPDIATLPTDPALDRSTLWSVALSMIESRPLFGQGSQGFRMNYAAFAPPNATATAAKPPPHAHNLTLELLADWGLIGGGLLIALFLVMAWPLIQRVVAGQVAHVWELAVIGAIAAMLGHGLVDCFLTKQDFVAMVWVLLGLASLMGHRSKVEPG